MWWQRIFRRTWRKLRLSARRSSPSRPQPSTSRICTRTNMKSSDTLRMWPKWSNGAASLKTFVSFVSHLNRILTVIRHLVNVIADFILKFQPQSKQSVRPTIKIEWNLNTIPENLNSSDIAAFEICRLSLHLPGVILCVRRKNFSRSTFGRRDQATFESWCHLS